MGRRGSVQSIPRRTDSAKASREAFSSSLSSTISLRFSKASRTLGRSAHRQVLLEASETWANTSSMSSWSSYVLLRCGVPLAGVLLPLMLPWPVRVCEFPKCQRDPANTASRKQRQAAGLTRGVALIAEAARYDELEPEIDCIVLTKTKARPERRGRAEIHDKSCTTSHRRT